MRQIVAFFMFLSCNMTLLAQIDSVPNGKVTYFQVANLPGDIQNNGISTLLFNRSASLYVQNSAPTKDSSFSSPEYVSASVAGDLEGFPILKLHKARKMYCKIFCRQSKDKCLVTDTLGVVVWTLHPEHRRFGQYDCRRATGHYRGRDYEAWYTLDVPIPTGPFKLGGLPGLILEATSLDGKVKFLFNNIQVSDRVGGVIRMPAGKDLEMSYVEYMEDRQRFFQAMIDDEKAKGGELIITLMETIELNTEN
jgi:GLPGLI family protein